MVKVLFIYDDPQAHATLRLVLPEPYVLLSASTGRQGVETAAREGPDVVLLDINLPDMDGLRALRLIAARPLAPPVVMLTASIIGQPQRAVITACFFGPTGSGIHRGARKRIGRAGRAPC